MNKQSKRLSRKGVKWIKSRFAKAYRIRRALKSMQSCMVAAQSVIILNRIRNTATSTPEQKLAKALAIAETVIEGHKGIANIWSNNERK